MLEILIAVIMSLGMSFGTSDNGKLSMDRETKARLENSQEFKEKMKSQSIDDIVVVPDIDPVE